MYISFKFAILAAVLFSNGNLALAAIPAQLCGIIQVANSGEFTPEELCKAHNKSFCSGISMGAAICKSAGASFCDDNFTEAQGICRAGGKSFCSDVENITEAVCMISGGSFCSSLSQDVRMKYYQEYAACKR